MPLLQSVGWPQLPLQNLPEYSSWLSGPMLQTLAPSMQPMLLQHHLGFSAGEPMAVTKDGCTSTVLHRRCCTAVWHVQLGCQLVRLL